MAFLHDFNGKVMWPSPPRSSPEIGLMTDAAGSEGFGAILGPALVAQRWPAWWEEAGLTGNIGFSELFPILVALSIWPEQLRNQSVVFWSDNVLVVECINNQTAKCKIILRLLKEIILLCMKMNVLFRQNMFQGY